MNTSRTSLSVSVRRHFIDAFSRSHEHLYTNGAAIIDIGGRKHGKRGGFDISAYPCRVTYVNIEPAMEPDIVADAAAIPLPAASFDLAIMGELLEHVPVPALVIGEAYRLLKPGGMLLATVPFMFPVHGDPGDYGRYTEQYWKEALAAAGYRDIRIQPQGSWYAVFALAVQAYFRFPARSRIARRFGKLTGPFIRALLSRDRRAGPAERAWTTGYGIIAVKA